MDMGTDEVNGYDLLNEETVTTAEDTQDDQGQDDGEG